MPTVRAMAGVGMHSAACKRIFTEETTGLTPELFGLRSWVLLKLDFPVLDVGFNANGLLNIRIRMLSDDYNDRPPAVELLSPEGAYLTEVKRDPAGGFNPGSHPATGRPFICMRGTREYHEHPNHRY